MQSSPDKENNSYDAWQHIAEASPSRAAGLLLQVLQLHSSAVLLESLSRSYMTVHILYSSGVWAPGEYTEDKGKDTEELKLQQVAANK